MANFIITPNMNLPNPTPGADPGPDYATNLQSSLTIIDGHNHSNGQGVQINPSGININADLPINSNNLTLINTARFVNLASSLAGSSPNLGCIYEAANNLYFNDGAGNVVQITAAGAVNATSSGISSGTATASFSGGVLVVNSNTNTPANIQCGSLLIGNVVASSNFCTLSCPSSLGAGYDLTLPPTNATGGTAFVTIDSSNNMGDTVVYPLVSASIANGAIATANIADGAVTLPKMAAANIVVTSSSGNFSVAPGSATLVTNFSATITTSGKPVSITFQSDGTSNHSTVGINAGTIATFAILRGATQIGIYDFSLGGTVQVPPGCLNFVDVVTAGTYTYTVTAQADNNGFAVFTYSVMVVREL